MVLSLALVGAFAFVAPGSAWATTGHTFADAFGGLGVGDGQFGEPQGNGPVGVAVMSSTGEVFTADFGQGVSGSSPRVQRFSADGVFQSSFPIDPAYSPEAGTGKLAVDPGGFGAVYVSALRRSDGGVDVLKYSAAGVKAYALDVGSSGVSINQGAEVAVDPVDGTVYVTVSGGIASFDATTGVFTGFFDGSTTPEGGFCPKGLAVDGSHRIYVLDECKNRVDRFSASGVFEAWLDPQLPLPQTLLAVAADPASDEVYVAHTGPVGMLITHFTAGGAAPIYTFDASDVGGVRAMAVSGLGTVYTSDASRAFVERFTSFEGPTVVTGDAPAETVEARAAVVEGTVDPEGVESSYHFEYGFDEKYGSRTEGETAVGSGSDPVAASSALSGLKPNRTYHYRIVGSNASGSIAGADQTFTTLSVPPDVDGAPGPPKPAFASMIGARSARLHGTVNPNSSPAFYHVEYGTTMAYGQRANHDGSDSGVSSCFFFNPICGDDIPVVGVVSGLEPSTTYHFRVVADTDTDFVDPQVGADQTFTTAPAASGGATGVTTRRATLTGTIDPHGEDTSYHFNYGPTTSYGASTPEVEAGDGDGDQQVSQAVSELLPDTTYHVQVVATSDNGVKRYGGDGLFRTAPAPTAVAISPIGVSTGAATLVGDLDTHGLAGSYRFDVSSLDSSYSSSTAERPVAGNDGTERVSAPVDGLPAGETFVVALVVTSNDSTEVSDLVTFATASVPRVFPPPPSGGGGSYGCSAPRLDSYDAKPKPGDTITIGGRDLGAGGTATLGDRSTVPADWTAGGFKLEIPDDASGTLGLTVNCGQRSNTVAIAIFKKPSSRFSIADMTVNGSRATLSVKVAGPGKLTSSAANAKPGRVTVKKARGAKLVIRLNRAGMRALRKSKTGRLKVPVRVRYLPAGGRSATKTVTVTFEHIAGR